jgi:hypothetical protein
LLGVVTGVGRPDPQSATHARLGAVRGIFRRSIGSATTLDRLSDGQRAFNRCKAGLRALVEQAIGHLATAWALRRWRGLL